MKKIIAFILLLCCMGCGKKLTCTYKENYEDIKINNKIIFNFKDNTYRQIDTMVFKESDEASDYYSDISDYIEEYNLILKDNKIISDLSGIFSDNKKNLKSKYEAYNYKCK